MSTSHSGRSRSPRDDVHFSTIPGINGRIPNGPRAHRQIDRGVVRYDSYRRKYDRDGNYYARRSPRNATVEAHRRNRSQRLRPRFYNPVQFLIEAFALRQREVAESAPRTAIVRQRSSHPSLPSDQRPHEAPDATIPRASSEISPRIQREQSDVLHNRESSQPFGESSLFVPQYQSTRNANLGLEGNAVTIPDTRAPSLNPNRSIEPIPREVPEGCTCAVENECAHKHHRLSDCRPLVQENPQWQKRKKDFEDNYHSEPSLNDNPQLETFAGTAEMTRMRTRINNVAHRGAQSNLLHNDFLNIADSIRCFQLNSVTKETLHGSGLLERLTTFLSPENRPRLARLDFPMALIEDLTILLTKWRAGDFGVLARRGCTYSDKTRQWSIDPDCLYRRKSDYYGHGSLTNGQTWLYRIDMVRDGAHGATRAGIAGTIEDGATSVVMSSKKTKANEYADVDRGEFIEYMSTAQVVPNSNQPTNLKDSVTHRGDRVTTSQKGIGPTDNTKKLVTSYRTGKPVRLFRGFRLRKIVPLRPRKGFRYDGLYIVKKFELMSEERQIYKFFLERMEEGQGPLRNVWAPTQDSDDDEGQEKSSKKRKRGETQS